MHETWAQSVNRAVSDWVEKVVVGLNLCPFARRELESGRVRYVATAAEDEEELLQVLHQELSRLDCEPAIETTILTHPRVLADFEDYNDFLGIADALLGEYGWEGTYQIASFHPQYQFEGTGPDDAENYTNRSPYPLLHLLRETSVARAVQSHPDIDAVPRRNVELLRQLGVEEIKRRIG